MGLACVALALGPARTLAGSGSRLPDGSLDLRLAAPIATWDEAVPLGNGLLGGLLWGETNLIRLSLDRGDLWDLRTPAAVHDPGFRYANLRRLVTESNQTEISRLFDAPYNHPTPTKIPAGRLEILLDPSQAVERFDLHLATAEGHAGLSDGRRIDAFFSAVAPVALLRLPGPAPRQIRLRVPGSGGGADTGPDSHAVSALGYPPARTGESGGLRWFEQDLADGGGFCVAAGCRRAGDATLVAVAIATRAEGKSPQAIAARRIRAALARGYDRSFASHRAWWARFWNQSRVEFPDPDILRHYYLVRYFYGAASRLGAPPMPLQGVWTADAGTLPPWKGDYHNDLNTQMSYMGYQAAGHFAEGRCFLEFNWDLLPAYRQFARRFFETPGANVPGVMSLAGDPLTGWPQYSLSPTTGAWLAHLFYLHWRYTADERFLRTRAWPWCREVGECLLALLRPDAQGRLVLPLSASPEIHDNSLRAWLAPNSNYDRFCLDMLFRALTDMARGVGRPDEAARWSAASARLGEPALGAEGALRLDAREDLRESHRHLSNLMGLYPFNLLTVAGGPAQARAIRASLDQWERLGTSAWCGYSFSWMSALRARVGDAEGARRYLDVFVKAFILRNGFHANGDQTRSGYSSFTYRPFTLEGNMLVAAAVQEMLLQSWSPRPGSGDWGELRLFPAAPVNWRDASFEDLRAEGGHRVSARRAGGSTVWFRVTAGREGLLRIRDDFHGFAPRWSRSGVRHSGGAYEIRLRKGQTIEAVLRLPPDPW